MAVVRGERKQRFAPALLPDERLLIGRPRELEVDADSLALRRGVTLRRGSPSTDLSVMVPIRISAFRADLVTSNPRFVVAENPFL